MPNGRHRRSVSFRPEALSAYLALRWLPSRDLAWAGTFAPAEPQDQAEHVWRVGDATELLERLRAQLSAVDMRRTGLLLSGGIDSAILAALLPGARAYTVRFEAEGAVDETPQAAEFAARFGLAHTVVAVTWTDYERFADALMLHKRSPLHAVEVGLFKAALRASGDGIDHLIVGNGADSNFGGLDKLLSRDWTLDEFTARYSFLDPRSVLRDAIGPERWVQPYRIGNGVDVPRFLREVHGQGITQAFTNAASLAGCTLLSPYEHVGLRDPLDLDRIRAGQPKYLVREAFRRLYPDLQPLEKVPFARPMATWLSGWQATTRREFVKPAVPAGWSGEQRWLVWCLDRFLNLVEEGLAPA